MIPLLKPADTHLIKIKKLKNFRKIFANLNLTHTQYNMQANVIDITGDGKLTKEILVEGHGESPKQNQTVEGNILVPHNIP